MFNTLRYAKKLEAAGVSREQAEAQIQIIAEILEEDMATKLDLSHTKDELKVDIHNLRVELHSFRDDLKKDISGVRTEMYTIRDDLKKDITTVKTELYLVRDDLRKDISVLEHKLALKLGTIITVAITAATAVIKLL